MSYDGIKFLIMDVDGTLTDGKIYMGEGGELFKAFDIKDGCGIKDILPEYGIIPVIITARKSIMLENRCSELGIKYLFQSERNKIGKLNEIIKQKSIEDKIDYSLSNVAYIGDDILDLQCIKPINNASGITGCPADAVDEIKKNVSFISCKNGGNGAVRDFIEYICNTQKKIEKFDDIRSCSLDAYDFIMEFIKGLHNEIGRYELKNGSYAMVQKYETKNRYDCKYESHKKYIDLQMIVEGEEIISVANTCNLKSKSEYDEENDVLFYESSEQGIDFALRKYDYLILKPTDAHRPCIRCNNSKKVKKIVIKIAR